MADLVMFPRQKPEWLSWSLVYRVTRLLRLLFGAERLARLCLNLEWMTWRLAYELSGEVFGARLVNEAYGVTRELLKTHVPCGSVVIDVGCGAGRVAALVPPGTRYIGLDRNVQALTLARVSYPGTRFVRHNLESDWADGLSGDVGLCIGVLEHLDDPLALLSTLRSVVRVLIVEVPDSEAHALNWARQRLGCRWYSDDDHVREYTPTLLEAHIRQAGWVPAQWVQRSGMVLVVAKRDGDGAK